MSSVSGVIFKPNHAHCSEVLLHEALHAARRSVQLLHCCIASMSNLTHPGAANFQRVNCGWYLFPSLSFPPIPLLYSHFLPSSLPWNGAPSSAAKLLPFQTFYAINLEPFSKYVKNVIFVWKIHMHLQVNMHLGGRLLKAYGERVNGSMQVSAAQYRWVVAGRQKFSRNFSDIKQRNELNANSLAVTVDAAIGCPAAGEEYPDGTGIAGVGKDPGTLCAPVIG